MNPPESELTLAGLTIYQIINEHFSDLIADHQVRGGKRGGADRQNHQCTCTCTLI